MNLVVFANQDRHQWFPPCFTIQDGSFTSMVFSMFYHADEAHLIMNMFALLRYGSDVFINTSSSKWQSPKTIISIYLLSGVSGSCGVLALSHLYQMQWDRRLQASRAAASCTHWLCGGPLGLNKLFGQPVADIYTHIAYSSEISALWYYKLAERLGASGAVYGVLGARIYTSYFSMDHSSINHWDAMLLVANLGYEITQSPLRLQDLWDGMILNGDGIDHCCHIFGLISGFLMSAFFQFLFVKRRYPVTGRGRRLGGEIVWL